VGKRLKVPCIVEAVYPLFDQVDNPHICALYAVTAGCDVFPGGIFGLGASKIITAAKQQLAANGGMVEFSRLVHYFAKVHKKKKLPLASLETIEAMILAFVDAFLYEPANTREHNANNNFSDGSSSEATINPVPPEFVSDETPRTLPKFIEAFAMNRPGIALSSGPSTRVCKGVGCGEHVFLEMDGYYSCSICGDGAVFCRFCCLKTPTASDNAATHCCFQSYSELLIGPLGHGHTMATTTFRTTEEMKKALHAVSIEIPSNMPPDDIEDIYDAMCTMPLVQPCKVKINW
jgi:hypothetical protein